ncbi:MAG: glutamine amidotransferase [Patescibacteria group bacterium]|nr:glutamine amidotransferase [Patescibacteria group bacterium]
MKKLVIAHLYPREMNIYGDLGNVITLKKRLEWRGYGVEVRPVEIGEPFDFGEVDLVFGGGGQDSGQLIMGEDLISRGNDLRQMAFDGVPMLVICGTYQLFGRGFTTLEGQEIPGIDVFRASTIGGRTRMIGNVVIDSPFGELVGFENHSGQTILEPGQAALGEVRKGHGNNPKSRQEGAVSENAIGTYLHGPVLPKNPGLADHLLLAAVRRRWQVTELEPLDDRRELAAARVAAGRPR